MKNIKKIILLLLIIATNGAKAQLIGGGHGNLPIYPDVPTYDTSECLKQYEGNWMYINGLDTIRVALRYNRTEINPGLIKDELYGWHEYKVGNTIIESKYKNRFMNLFSIQDSINVELTSLYVSHKFMSPFPACDTLDGYVHSFKPNNDFKPIRLVLDATKNHIAWYRNGGSSFPPFVQSIPNVFILTKQ